MSSQESAALPQPNRTPTFMARSTLSQTAQPVLASHPVNTAPIMAESSPSMAPTESDYFGHAWTNSTPPRISDNPSKSPSSQYSPHASRSRIKPGAKNSFARGVSGRAEATSPSAESWHGPKLPSSSLSDRDPPNLYDQSSRDVGFGREDNLAPTQEAAAKPRRKKTPSQKAMLSQALQKANQAVVLDNAQNFEGAMEAYNDACELLQQVMLRSSGDEEKRKLDAIRNTYKNRIRELRTNELSSYDASNKALPDVPVTPGRRGNEVTVAASDEEADDAFQDKDRRHDGLELYLKENQRALDLERLPPRRQSLIPRYPAGNERDTAGSSRAVSEHQNSWRQDAQQRANVNQASASFSTPMDRTYMPPPLSPRRPLSPSNHEPGRSTVQPQRTVLASDQTMSAHSRQATAESTSWLDTIDESGGSSNSSVHSGSSSIGLRRKHIRTGSGATEAEFDAALDAAVEAAYDDGYEPVSGEEDARNNEPPSVAASSSYFASVKKNIDLAKQRVRDAEREAAIVSAREHERRRRLEQQQGGASNEAFELSYEDNEAEEEERMLEEMTREYILDEADYGLAFKSTVPRTSDSSGLPGKTWGNSLGSVSMTAGTTLATVIENTSPATLSINTEKPSASFSPPLSALPPAPQASLELNGASRSGTAASLNPSFMAIQSPGVRDRRLSGQKVKQLKIDTNARLPLGATGPKTQPPGLGSPRILTRPFADAPKSASLPLEGHEVRADLDSQAASQPIVSRKADSDDPRPSSPKPLEANTALGTPPLSSNQSPPEEPPPLAPSPVRAPSKIPSAGALRKNYSSSSLRSLKQQPSTPLGTEDSPGTPIGRAFSSSSISHRNESLPVLPDMPTPAATSLGKGGFFSGNLSFFDNDIHSPMTPGSPNTAINNAPAPLEPCPESFLLRPFWLMRAIYQTIAHPRGGYISTRLFVPRDAWRVKNVKLRNVDEKVANCDLLTAALLNLQKVDTLDADVVLEEMQAFELILDQVQGQLGKKLGAEVGVNGSAAIFKASPITDELGPSDALSSKLGSTSGKSYLSWKRLRSKHSTGPTLPAAGNVAPGKENARDLTMRSLPMTAAANPRVAKRDPTKVLGIGPHSHYMAALGRLCDAVQVLDQIARQVEDPGLRLSSQTHVGLELCVRHAAEFFAFFVCRFALADIGMMLDKFVKRGSEWVLT